MLLIKISCFGKDNKSSEMLFEIYGKITQKDASKESKVCFLFFQ